MDMKHNKYGVLNQEAQDFLYAAEREFVEKIAPLATTASQLEIRLLSQHVIAGLECAFSEMIMRKTMEQRKEEKFEEAATRLAKVFTTKVLEQLAEGKRDLVDERNSKYPYQYRDNRKGHFDSHGMLLECQEIPRVKILARDYSPSVLNRRAFNIAVACRFDVAEIARREVAFLDAGPKPACMQEGVVVKYKRTE